MGIYIPLQFNEIRLFHIEPWSKCPQDPLRLSLFAIRLDCLPRYEALSYVWGDNSNRIPITINEQNSLIGRNLYDALIELRAEKPLRRTLWVDAICINQLDTSEKSQQVARMTEVYSNASSTIMWIRQEQETLGSALHDIHELNKHALESNHPQVDGLSYMFGNKLIYSMDHVMSQDYFSRSWITQEIVVSRCPIITSSSGQVNFDEVSLAFRRVDRLQPGNSRYAAQFVALDTLRKAISNTRKATYDTIGDCKDCPKDDGPHHNGSKELVVIPDLTHLLISERDKGATDPRDKVYALLAVNGMAGCGQFFPDYSMTTNDLYIAVAAQLIQQSGGLRILSSSQPRYSTRNLPSWVPDWSQPWRGGIDRRDRFTSGKSFKSRLHVNTDKKTLSLQGVKVNTVRKVYTIPFTDWEYIDIRDPLADVLVTEAARLGLSSSYFTTEDRSVVLLQILVAGRGSFVMSNDLLRFHSYASAGDIEWNPYNLIKRRWDRFKDNLAWLENEWDMFETEDGFVGLAPTSTLPGDAVWILGDSNVPFILRPREQEGYELVGECYFHGFMNGQLDLENASVEEITIW